MITLVGGNMLGVFFADGRPVLMPLNTIAYRVVRTDGYGAGCVQYYVGGDVWRQAREVTGGQACFGGNLPPQRREIP